MVALPLEEERKKTENYQFVVSDIHRAEERVGSDESEKFRNNRCGHSQPLYRHFEPFKHL